MLSVGAPSERLAVVTAWSTIRPIRRLGCERGVPQVVRAVVPEVVRAAAGR